MSGDTAPAPPRAGRRRLFSWLIVACVLVLAVGLVAAQFVKSPAQVAAETAPPPLTVLTAPVEQRVLSSTVAMEGVVRTRSTVTVAVPAGGDSGSSVVTAVKVKRGQQVRPGTVLLEVSDRPLIVLEGAIPAYRDLGPGSSGGDVARLQQSLHWLGYGTGADREGSYGAGTSGAVARLYEDRGYQARHAAEAPTDDDGNRTAARSGGVMVPAAEVIFLQSFPARVQQVTTSVGGTGGGSAMRLASGDLVVEATVAQVDGESIVEGQRASIIFDDGRDQRARVRTVRPVSGGASADAEDADVSEAQYAVTARPAGELAARELGQQVRLVVVTGATNGAVLALPVAAISTDESGTSYVTVVTGSGAERRVDVVAGFFADGYVEVTPVRGQLGVGDQARLGIAAPSQLDMPEDGSGEPTEP